MNIVFEGKSEYLEDVSASQAGVNQAEDEVEAAQDAVVAARKELAWKVYRAIVYGHTTLKVASEMGLSVTDVLNLAQEHIANNRSEADSE